MGPGRGGGRGVGSGRIVTYRGLTDYPETLHTGGMQSNVFFRWHQDVDAPCFCAHHAWSAPWGSEFSADGTTYRCPACDEGWVDCDRGYSSVRSAEELADYFQEHAKGAPADDHGHVVVFEGEHVGDGCDGEPLAVPTRIVERLTWSAFAAKHLHKEDSITNPLGCDLIDAADYTTGQDDIC